MKISLRKLLGSKSIFIFLAGALGFLLLTIWLPNLRFVLDVLVSPKLSLAEKAPAVFSFGALATNFTVFGAVVAVMNAILFGVNAALLVYYFTEKKAALLSGGVGALGALAGMLGVGCASCGSVALSLFGLSGAAAILPFGGVEFAVAGTFLLGFSAIYTLHKLVATSTCQS